MMIFTNNTTTKIRGETKKEEDDDQRRKKGYCIPFMGIMDVDPLLDCIRPRRCNPSHKNATLFEHLLVL